MKKHVLGLTIATLLLAACGGSGSDNDSPADPQKPNNNGATPIAPGKEETPTDPGNNNGRNPDGSSDLIPPPTNQGDKDKEKPKAAYQGKAFIVPLGQQPKSLAEAKDVSSDDLAILNLAGKQLPLQLSNLNQGNINSIRGAVIGNTSYKQFVVSGSNYKNSKFGYVNDGTDDYIFSQGALTANMPASGVVKYSGAAAVGRAAVVDTAVANFSADFGAKTLTGKITQNAQSNLKFNPIDIAASINGNHFSSKDDATVKTTGSFYGDNARELGGIFQDSTQVLSGSYGAIRTN